MKEPKPLTLEQWAAMLPHRTRFVRMSDRNTRISYETINGLSINGVYTADCITPIPFSKCKPLLHDLSSLTKHGTYGDFTGVPIHRLYAIEMEEELETFPSHDSDMFAYKVLGDNHCMAHHITKDGKNGWQFNFNTNGWFGLKSTAVGPEPVCRQLELFQWLHAHHFAVGLEEGQYEEIE